MPFKYLSGLVLKGLGSLRRQKIEGEERVLKHLFPVFELERAALNEV